MGNRACIVLYDTHTVSPTVYLHWHGTSVPAWLEQLKTLMTGRIGDAPYAAARFVGICHSHIEGNLSLGVMTNNLTLRVLMDTHRMDAKSPGNAGIVVVDTKDFTWKAYGGSLADDTREESL